MHLWPKKKNRISCLGNKMKTTVWYLYVLIEELKWKKLTTKSVGKEVEQLLLSYVPGMRRGN